MSPLIQTGNTTCRSVRIFSYITLLLPSQRESKFAREIEGSVEENNLWGSSSVGLLLWNTAKHNSTKHYPSPPLFYQLNTIRLQKYVLGNSRSTYVDPGLDELSDSYLFLHCVGYPLAWDEFSSHSSELCSLGSCCNSLSKWLHCHLPQQGPCTYLCLLPPSPTLESHRSWSGESFRHPGQYSRSCKVSICCLLLR